jgi:lysine/ornithine N-monooxygenase
VGGERTTDLLIVGAGPFGLALAAYARSLGLDHLIVGHPMGFWRANMPAGMILRSASDWHLDPPGEHTIEAYLATLGLTPREAEPLTRARYLDYCEWFRRRRQIEPLPVLVARLDRTDGGLRPFEATLEDGTIIRARAVVLALGFRPFTHVPDELAALLPAGRWAHTGELVDFTALAGERCLIVGGRQSAFEWTALLHEAGAGAVHVAYRHATPAFAAADWSWVMPLVDRLVTEPGWYRRLSQPEKDEVGRRLWAEGRLKLEPWLATRIDRPGVRLWPGTRLAACRVGSDGALGVTFDGGDGVQVDQVILATGYRVDLTRVSLLAGGNLLGRLARRNGYPVLDEQFQTNLPGLYMTSMAAVGDFGPYFAFTIAARTSALLIGRAVARFLRSE